MTDAPEISVYHWFYKHGDTVVNNSRYVELWLPIAKRV